MLDDIIERFKNSRNIQEKEKLKPILNRIREQGYKSEQIYASIGEDSAAIRLTPESEDLILISTDALLPQFVIKSPYGAGFSSIYVGIDDIMAAGGIPIACTSTVEYGDPKLGEQIFKGMLEATNRFHIPLIRGHTTTDSEDTHLTTTIIGTAKISQFLSAKNAQIGNFIAIVWDRDGKPAAANKYYWDTITMKETEEFYGKRDFIRNCIARKLITTCKDISNGGILGTLLQLLEYNKKGAILDIEKINQQYHSNRMPYSLLEFLFLFLTSGFIITGSNLTKSHCQAEIEKSKMIFYEIGEIIEGNSIYLQDEQKKKKLI
ncbi:AIR synthase related protein [Candidatus Lokiarchaeum ossiferum]|uniref:AIR synthase related protein n=1 Tax=Candidatus Lokiarchaeum ossiferum TaxID=2951803 RepID=UPI00352FCCDB